MAEPSLGYAIGLNVKRQDIFAPAAKQLSQNIATWKAEKAQAKKEKEAKASKVMDDMMKLDPSTFNRKIRNEATISFEKFKKELEDAAEAGENERKLLDIVYQAKRNLASYRDQSDNRDALEKQVLANPESVPTVLRMYSQNNINRLSPDEIALLPGFGINYDPETNIITSFGFKPVDVRAELNQAKPTEEELLASAKGGDIQKNISIIKTKAGYDAIAFTKLTTDQQRYALSLANVMDSNPGAIGSISEEVLRKEYGGDYDRYLMATRSKLDEMTRNTKEGDPPPTPFDAQRAVAIDYMVKTHAPEWIASSTRIKDLNEQSKQGGAGNDGQKISPSEISEEPQITQRGIDNLEAAGLAMSVEDAVDMYLGNKPTDPETKKKLNKALNGNIFGSMPTIAFQPGTTEVITIGREQTNPRKMFYDTKKKKFYIIYDQAVGVGGYTEPLKNQVREIVPSEMKQLRRKLGKELEIWDALAPSKGLPKTEDYALGRRMSSSGAKAPAPASTTVNYGDK